MIKQNEKNMKRENSYGILESKRLGKCWGIGLRVSKHFKGKGPNGWQTLGIVKEASDSSTNKRNKEINS